MSERDIGMEATRESLEALARKEIRDEDFRLAVEQAKVRIRERMKRPWWRKVFPYRIKLEKL